MKLHLLATVAGLGTVLAVAPAYAADEAGASTAAAGSTDSGSVLQEVVVTAQHRSENLQRAAIAVSVLAPDAIARQNVTQAPQLTNLVPALQVANGGATNLFYLRGVGTFAVNAYSDPAIAFNYDGVYISRPNAATGVFYDLERIEVLKGPQGTLYGRNATGGAINVLPAKPKIGENSGDISAVFGNYGTVTVQGAANVSLSADTALRLAGIYTKHDGYLSDGLSDEDGKGARAQLLYKPTDRLSIRVGGDYYHAGGNGGGVTLAATLDPLTNAITPSPYGRDVGLYDPRIQAIPRYSLQVGRNLAPINPYAFRDSTYWGVNADIELVTDLGVLSVIPAYRDSDYNTITDATSSVSHFIEHSRQETLEARFASPDNGKLKYLVGGYYYHEGTDFANRISEQALSFYPTGKLGTTSLAAFGRLTYAITDSLRLTGGVRYTHDRKTVDGVGTTLIDVCVAPACPNGLLLPYAASPSALVQQLGLIPVPGGIYISPSFPTNIVINQVAPIDAKQTKGKLTWRAAVEYDLGPQSLLYASYETGYRGGGFSFVTDPSRQQYRPETVDAYTIGSKNRFLDNRVQLNMEAFYWKYRDQQIAHIGADSTGAPAFFTENAGDSRNYGAEVEAKYLATPTTLLSANVQYLNTKYTKFSYKTPQPPPTRCTVTPPAPGGGQSTVDCSGLTALRSPRWTMVYGAQQTIPVGDNKIVLEGNARYQSNSYIGFELLDAERQLAYWSGNVSITFSPNNERWSVSAFANNIHRHRPYTDMIYDGIFSNIAASVGAPTLYGVRLAASF